MAYTERFHPKGVPFSGFYMHLCARVGILLVEVYERIGKTVILVSKKAQKGLTDAFHICSGAPNVNFRKISVRKTI